MNNDIKSIVDLAVWAPSGDNSQPWKFRIKGNRVRVYLIRDKDNPILNFKHSGTYIANGAIVENIVIAAGHFGYRANVSLLPDPKDADLVAEIGLVKDPNAAGSPLFPYIKERCTNRNPYKRMPLSAAQTSALAALSEGSCRVSLIHDGKAISEVAKACAVMERVALETRSLHELFFQSIVWSRREEQDKGIGLYYETLGLPPPVLAAFKVVKYWPVTRVLNALGFSKKAASGNARTYASSAAMAVIVIDSLAPIDYIKAGRLMQRVWLTAAKLGLSMQPVTGTLFLAQRVIAGDLGGLPPRHSALIRSAYDTIMSAFGIKNGTLAMQFRIGIGEKPRARSLRVPPQIVEE